VFLMSEVVAGADGERFGLCAGVMLLHASRGYEPC